MKTSQRVLVERGDVSAPRGSRSWCVFVRDEGQRALRSTKSSREHARYQVEGLRENNHFQTLTDEDGSRFMTWEQFCLAREPFGFGMTPEEVEQTILAKPLAQELAAIEQPRLPEKGEIGGGHTRNYNIISGQQGTSALYLVRRLQRDFPEIAKSLARGEYKSARAAGIAAGIVHVPTPVDIVRRAWAKASAREREEIRRILNERSS